jgi:hypothetical protein
VAYGDIDLVNRVREDAFWTPGVFATVEFFFCSHYYALRPDPPEPELRDAAVRRVASPGQVVVCHAWQGWTDLCQPIHRSSFSQGYQSPLADFLTPTNVILDLCTFRRQNEGIFSDVSGSFMITRDAA